jgi:O-antigen ligase
MSSAPARVLRAADAASVERAVVPVVLSGVLAGLALASGGFFSDSWVWSTVVLSWLAAVVLILRAELALARAELLWVGALALLAAWTALSAVWSVDPTQSVLEARRALVYVAVAAVVVVALRSRDVESLLVGVWAAIAVASLYGLTRYLLGAAHERVADVAQGPLLYRPIGYANGLGAFLAIGVLLAAGIALHGGRIELRLAAAASLVPFAAALALTQSRGAAVALCAGAAFALAADPRRRAYVRLLPVVAAAAAAAALAAGSGLTSAETTLSPRIGGGVLAAATLALALCACAALLALDRRGLELRARVPKALAAAAVAVLLAATALGAYAAASRLSDSGRRNQYASVAWREYTSHPLLGSGAGTFGRYWERIGPADAGGARDAHNLYLETLAELGPFGLLILCAALAVPLTRFRATREHPLATPAAAAYAVFVVHAALDWDWELPAVTVAALFCGGSLLVLARRDDAARWPWTIAVAALLILAAAALAGLAT